MTREDQARCSRNRHSDERGIAIVIALFMTMMVSALAASMATWRAPKRCRARAIHQAAHARHGAESGLAAATNYLPSTPYAITDQGPAPIR